MGIVETICSDIPKSFVIVRKKNNASVRQKTKVSGPLLSHLNNKDKVYLTNISSVTLLKRSENEVQNQFDM